MLFQLVTYVSLSMIFVVNASQVMAKSSSEKKHKEMYLQCQFVDLLNGDEESIWAVDHKESYVKLTGEENEDDAFVVSQNKQLVKDYCTYTKRAHYGAKSALYQETGLVASPHSFSNARALVFLADASYPKHVDRNWANKVQPHKGYTNNHHFLVGAKLAAFAGLSVIVGGISLYTHTPISTIFDLLSKPLAFAAAVGIGVDLLLDDRAGFNDLVKFGRSLKDLGKEFKPSVSIN